MRHNHNPLSMLTSSSSSSFKMFVILICDSVTPVQQCYAKYLFSCHSSVSSLKSTEMHSLLERNCYCSRKYEFVSTFVQLGALSPPLSVSFHFKGCCRFQSTTGVGYLASDWDTSVDPYPNLLLWILKTLSFSPKLVLLRV